MSDIQLDERRDGRNRRYGIEGQAMAGMTFDAERFRVLGGARDPLELTVAIRPFRLAKGAGVKLDHRGAEGLRGIELANVRFDKQGHANTGCIQLFDVRCEMIMCTGRVQPALGRAFLALFRHDASGMRRMA